MKPLVLCADDYAVHAGASSGIVRLLRQGRLSATSVMSLSPRWAQDAAALRELRGRADVGLHLDWTSDFAIAAGHGMALSVLMLRAALGGVRRAAARVLIEQQFDAFETHWHAAPDHIDGHQHVQQFAGIREALLDVIASRYGSAGAPYLRVSQAAAGEANLKSRIIAAMGASALRERAAGAGVPCAAALSGVYDFTGDEARYASLMRHWLRHTPAGIVMCHPAETAPPEDSIGAARCREFAYLGSQTFADDLAAAGVVLARGSR